jgi:hypothetical protein
MPYDWGDGNKTHSISRKQHQKNVKAKRAAKLNDPARFTAPRGATDVNRDADKSADLRYGGQERALGQQEQQVPVYYQQYRDQLAGIQTGIKTGYDQAIKDVSDRAAVANAADDKSRAATGQSMQKDAAQRGATVDPNLLAADARAQGIRNQGQQGFANLLTAQSAANGGYYGGLQASGSAAELGEKTRIGKEKQGVATEKGAYKSGYVTDARESERKYGLERSAFGLDVAKEQNDTAIATTKIRQDAKKRKADAKAKGQEVNKYGYTNEQWGRFSPSHRQRIQKQLGSTGSGATQKGSAGLTPKQKADAQAKRGKATQRIVDAESRWNMLKTKKYDFGDGKPRAPTPSELKERMATKEGFSPAEVHLALMWSSNKPWTAKDRATAKRLGIRLPKRNGAKPGKPVKAHVSPPLNKQNASSVANPFD